MIALLLSALEEVKKSDVNSEINARKNNFKHSTAGKMLIAGEGTHIFARSVHQPPFGMHTYSPYVFPTRLLTFIMRETLSRLSHQAPQSQS